MIQGKIHSLESFGTVDGPGIRFVVFLQGCPLRCLYCHNPDSWDRTSSGQYLLTPEELLAEVLRYKSFIAKGGVTVTGGEPLLQAEFVRAFFRLCKEEGIHTALDTSGAIATKTVFDALDITKVTCVESTFKIRWLLMAMRWVYCPRYLILLQGKSQMAHRC